MNLKLALAGVVAVGTLLVAPHQAQAQQVVYSPSIEELENTNAEDLNDKFEKAMYTHDQDYFTNRSGFRQISYMFGPGILVRDSFPENEVYRDGRAVHRLYREAMSRQMSGRVLRVVDHPNPFRYTVRNLPIMVSTPIPPATSSLGPDVYGSPATPPPSAVPIPALW
jgi:hypothetical protein